MSQSIDTLSTLVEKHIEEIGEDTIISKIEDIKEDYISDWEDEFDSVFDAYEEQGLGEAESHILNIHAWDVLGSDASVDEMASFMEEMAYQLGLSLN